jgi:hypothetical protein
MKTVAEHRVGRLYTEWKSIGSPLFDGYSYQGNPAGRLATILERVILLIGSFPTPLKEVLCSVPPFEGDSV